MRKAHYPNRYSEKVTGLSSVQPTAWDNRNQSMNASTDNDLQSPVPEIPALSPFDRFNQTLASNVHPADWINPTKDGDADLLQHVLLASRTSCHWEGNEYSQAGKHA